MKVEQPAVEPRDRDCVIFLQPYVYRKVDSCYFLFISVYFFVSVR